jgi:hypothetical protein
MAVVAIDPSRGVRKSILLTHEQVEELEQFRLYLRSARGRMPSESAALAELIQEGVRRWREEQEANKGSR